MTRVNETREQHANNCPARTSLFPLRNPALRYIQFPCVHPVPGH